MKCFIKCLWLSVILAVCCSGPSIIVEEDIATLKEGVFQDSNDAVAHYNLGLAYLSQDYYDSALTCFYHSIERQPHFSLGHFAIYCTEYKKDEILYRENLNNDTSASYQGKIDSIQNYLSDAFIYNPFFNWQVGVILLKPKESAYDIYTQEALDYIYEIFYDGFQSFFLGKYTRAIKELSYTLKLLPTYHQARYFRGLAHAHMKDYQAAIEDFKVMIDSLEALNENRILPIFLETADLYYLIGWAYLENNNLDQAEQAFRQVLIQDMSYYMAHFKLSQIHQRRKEYQKAINELDAAIYTAPKDPVLRYNEAVFLSHLGYTTESIEVYEQAIALNKYLYKAYFNLGLLYTRINQNNKALKMYQAFIEFAPKKEKEFIGLAREKIDQLYKIGVTLK